MVILNEVKDFVVPAFPPLSSSTFVIEDPGPLSLVFVFSVIPDLIGDPGLLPLVVVAAASHAAFFLAPGGSNQARRRRGRSLQDAGTCFKNPLSLSHHGSYNADMHPKTGQRCETVLLGWCSCCTRGVMV